ncbi:F420-non-reducing hydrogenase iron-sulfur subunit [Candidatus Methanophagaceae archaeon]|nr:F420-non-reducing hydrogenase iron-sulfur subunit [Methanophagales archaeon]
MGEEVKGEFEPRIIGFTCNWCTYAAADLAGTARMKYPPNIRLIRQMCSGRVDPLFVLKVFLRGADGVFIGGCHPGECHYMAGNLSARRRYSMMKKLLESVGIDPKRLRMEWISASEGIKFSDTVKEFTAQIKGLGPGPFRHIEAEGKEQK